MWYQYLVVKCWKRLFYSLFIQSTNMKRHYMLRCKTMYGSKREQSIECNGSIHPNTVGNMCHFNCARASFLLSFIILLLLLLHFCHLVFFCSSHTILPFNFWTEFFRVSVSYWKIYEDTDERNGRQRVNERKRVYNENMNVLLDFTKTVGKTHKTPHFFVLCID